MENWNLSTKKGMPNFDGNYLCFISKKNECGTTSEYQRIVQCNNNRWIIEFNEEIIYWKKLEHPLSEIRDKEELINVLDGLVSDVGNLLCDVADLDFEWQQAGYYETAKVLLKRLHSN
jgi:hypothetical protein